MLRQLLCRKVERDARDPLVTLRRARLKVFGCQRGKWRRRLCSDEGDHWFEHRRMRLKVPRLSLGEKGYNSIGGLRYSLRVANRGLAAR